MTGEPIRDDELDGLFHFLGRYQTLVVAVSGGADSMALLLLLQRWAARQSHGGAPGLVVATVDHGLRAGSADEARLVAALAARMGLHHHILKWEGEKPVSALQEAARSARYRLLEALAGTLPHAAIVTAHTRDDQVETFLMQLARGSGLDGLCAMLADPGGNGSGAALHSPPARPLIDVPKPRLVATLQAAGVPWIEDPSNDAPVFERVRWRQVRATLEGLGLGDQAIARSARRLQRGREALDAAAQDVWRRGVDVNGGAFGSLSGDVLDAAPCELAIRVLRRLVMAFGGRGEAPPLSQLEDLEQALRLGDVAGRSLAGVIVRRRGAQIRVLREPGRAGLPTLTLRPGEEAVWDNRFAITLSEHETRPIDVRGLGRDGLQRLSAIEQGPRRWPADVAVTLPSFWRDGELVAVPHIGTVARGTAESYPLTPRLVVNFAW